MTEYTKHDVKTCGFRKGELQVIVSVNGGKSIFHYREIFQNDLKFMVKDGPIPWTQFQRMASAGYGTGAVGRIQQAEKEKRECWLTNP